MKANIIAMVAICVVVISAYSGCTKDQAANAPGPNEVWIKNTAFNPSELHVPVNTTVKWTNMDNQQHTVTSDSGIWDSGILDVNAAFTFQFNSKGTFPYQCLIHNGMAGKVIVE